MIIRIKRNKEGEPPKQQKIEIKIVLSLKFFSFFSFLLNAIQCVSLNYDRKCRDLAWLGMWTCCVLENVERIHFLAMAIKWDAHLVDATAFKAINLIWTLMLEIKISILNIRALNECKQNERIEMQSFC